MELTYSQRRGYHHRVCQLCGRREREQIPDQAPEEYGHNPGNPVLGLCPNCNHRVGTARIVICKQPPHTGAGDADGGDGEALSYDRLEGKWQEWARIAKRFLGQVDAQDRGDLLHDIIVRLAEVAREYQEKKKPLTRWGMIRVAQYTRLRYYHQKKRWARVAGISLNGTVQDEDGYETEMIDTVPDEREIDLDSWLDAKAHYRRSSERMKETVQKRISGAELSGWEWKLLKRFRSEYVRQE